MWLYKLRKLNGPNFTYPLLMFSGALSEKRLEKMGKIYGGKPLEILNRKELIATLKPKQLQYLPQDCGDFPDDYVAPKSEVVAA